VADYAKLALRFEANQGQIDGRVKFLARGSGYALFLTRDEAVFALQRASRRSTGAKNTAHPQSALSKPIPSESTEYVRMKLVEANSASRVSAVDELPGKTNYFIGNDPSKWRRNVPTYARVKYESVYPGVDLIYYGNQQQLEYDFVVAPAADPKAIRLSFPGAELSVDDQGNLVLQAKHRQIRFRRPRVYQEIDGKRRTITAYYSLRGRDTVGFALASYDSRKPLVIDPRLVYSTYLGGNGNDVGSGIAVDSAGNVYMTGQTTSTNFPTANALQGSFAGGTSDVFIAKINSSGSALLYSTYLGGSADDIGSGIAVDSTGNAFITGYTGSKDFPTANALQPKIGGAVANAFITKISASGSTLLYSTYLGGTAAYGYAIAADSAGNGYVTGATTSNDFPTVNALQSTYGGGGSDAFIAKINSSGSALVYSTYLGGSGAEEGDGIAADSAGNAYVVGITTSINFPTANALQPSFGGGFNDAFVAKINASGSALVYSTYLGGNGNDLGYAIALDSARNVYVTGETISTNFPTVNPIQPTFAGGGSDIFVSKINAGGSALVYSTYLGGSNNESGRAIALDSSGNAFVTGQTNSPNFPTVAALQSLNGTSDVFVTKINANGTALVYSTYLGGSSDDGGRGVAVDATGDAYVNGYTASANFPTANALQPNFGFGGADAFVTKISTTDFTLSALPTAVTVRAGGAASYMLTVTPSGGFTGNLSWNCAGTPAMTACSVTPDPLVVTSANPIMATLTLQTSGSGTIAALVPPSGPGSYHGAEGKASLVYFSLLVISMLPVYRFLRFTRRAMAGLVLLGTLLLSVGCGGGMRSGGNTPPGLYGVTVTATSGSLSHNVTVTLVVQ
jgi:hypothetical protein